MEDKTQQQIADKTAANVLGTVALVIGLYLSIPLIINGVYALTVISASVVEKIKHPGKKKYLVEQMDENGRVKSVETLWL